MIYLSHLLQIAVSEEMLYKFGTWDLLFELATWNIDILGGAKQGHKKRGKQNILTEIKILWHVVCRPVGTSHQTRETQLDIQSTLPGVSLASAGPRMAFTYPEVVLAYP